MIVKIGLAVENLNLHLFVREGGWVIVGGWVVTMGKQSYVICQAKG